MRAQWCTFPPLRHAIDDAGVLVAREAKADEPLAMQQPRRFFQQRHPVEIVFNQVVVGETKYQLFAAGVEAEEVRGVSFQ